MDTDQNEQNAEPATANALAEDQRTRRDDSLNGRDPSVTADLNGSLPRTETDGPQSTVEMSAEGHDNGTVLVVGSTHDADDTPAWDSQATVTEWVESTLGGWSSTAPFWGESAPEVVPGFEIRGELGRGGMGIVYKAHQEKLKRLVALKMIRSDWHCNAEHLARFEIEAEAVARLNHPNIVRIHGFGRVERGPYVVLELLEGGTLKERLAGTPQPFREAATVLSALAPG